MTFPDIRDDRRFKDKLTAHELTLGTFIQVGGPEVVEICGAVDLDFVILDTEHTPVGWERLGAMCVSALYAGTFPLLRVGAVEQALVTRALDAGRAWCRVPAGAVGRRGDGRRTRLPLPARRHSRRSRIAEHGVGRHHGTRRLPAGGERRCGVRRPDRVDGRCGRRRVDRSRAGRRLHLRRAQRPLGRHGDPRSVRAPRPRCRARPCRRVGPLPRRTGRHPDRRPRSCRRVPSTRRVAVHHDRPRDRRERAWRHSEPASDRRPATARSRSATDRHESRPCAASYDGPPVSSTQYRLAQPMPFQVRNSFGVSLISQRGCLSVDSR